MFLLDTNHCSRIILGDPKIVRHISLIDQSQIATSVIVQGELTFMMENSIKQKSNLAQLNEFLCNIRIYLVNSDTANFYGQLKALLFKQFAPKDKEKRRRTTITDIGFDDNDIWIVATALQHNLIIVSDDSDFKRMQTVITFPLENWCS
jgi:tRNA(fMet)-specific endonuclease VapC